MPMPATTANDGIASDRVGAERRPSRSHPAQPIIAGLLIGKIARPEMPRRDDVQETVTPPE